MLEFMEEPVEGIKFKSQKEAMTKPDPEGS